MHADAGARRTGSCLQPAASPPPAGQGRASAAATSSITDGTRQSATTSWIFGPARSARSRDPRRRGWTGPRAAWAASAGPSGAPWRSARSSAATSGGMPAAGQRRRQGGQGVAARARRAGPRRRPGGSSRAERRRAASAPPRPARAESGSPASTATRRRSSTSGSSRSARSHAGPGPAAQPERPGPGRPRRAGRRARAGRAGRARPRRAGWPGRGRPARRRPSGAMRSASLRPSGAPAASIRAARSAGAVRADAPPERGERAQEQTAARPPPRRPGGGELDEPGRGEGAGERGGEDGPGHVAALLPGRAGPLSGAAAPHAGPRHIPRVRLPISAAAPTPPHSPVHAREAPDGHERPAWTMSASRVSAALIGEPTSPESACGSARAASPAAATGSPADQPAR